MLRYLLYCPLLLVLLSCHKNNNDDTPGPDPCANYKTPTTAGFSVYENDDFIQLAGSNWIKYATDTVSTSFIMLTADQDSTPGTTYTWNIQGLTFRKKSINAYISNWPLGTSIPVTLMVTRPTNKTCLPNDSGFATLTKNVVFDTTCLVFGTWQGYRDGNTQDTMTITIQNNRSVPPLNYEVLPAIYNLDGNGIWLYSYDRGPLGTLPGYKELVTGALGFVGNNYKTIPAVSLVGPGSNNIIINYTMYYPSNGQSVKHVFTGKRKL